MTEEINSNFVEIKRLAQDFCSSAQKVKKEAFRALAPSQRAELVEVLNEIIKNSKELVNVLNARCPYCRKEGGEDLGKCAECGRDMCSLCGKLFDGEPLHSGVCAMWHTKDKKEKEE